MTERNDITMTR